jgi:hypothetical protein
MMMMIDISSSINTLEYIFDPNATLWQGQLVAANNYRIGLLPLVNGSHGNSIASGSGSDGDSDIHLGEYFVLAISSLQITSLTHDDMITLLPLGEPLLLTWNNGHLTNDVTIKFIVYASSLPPLS